MHSRSKGGPICPIFESQRQVTLHSPESLVTERKFDTALRRSQLDNFFLRGQQERHTLDDKLLLQGLYNAGITYDQLKIDNACYARLLKRLLDNKVSARKVSAHDIGLLGRIWESVKLNLECQMGYMNSTNYTQGATLLSQNLSDYFDEKRPDNTLSLLMIACVKFSTLIEKLGLLQGISKKNKNPEQYMTECCKVNKWSDDGLGLTIIWSERLCVLKFSTGECYLLPRPYLLLIHNKICDLISVLVCSKSMEGVSTTDDFYTSVIRFVQELCRLNIQHQNEYYTIIKSLESLVVAESLRKVDSWDNREFYDSLVDELYLESGFTYEGSKLQQLLQEHDIPSQHELACLSKIVGHPFVSMKGGAKTLHKKVTETYDLDRVTLAKCECHIKINYIRNHIVRDKKWPPCFLNTGLVHPAIKEAWAKNIDPYHMTLKEKYGTPDVLDFQAVELAPNIKYSKLENTIPYLKDKTISLLRSRVISNYISRAVQNWKDVEKYESSWKDTRLLLYYLMNPTSVLNHDKYIDMFAQSTDLEDLMDYLVIRCVPKEKELKIDPRFFGCKTYEERFRSLSQEKNAMKFLELYCDEQAMTLSELELARRLIAFRRLRMAYKDHIILYIVIDASSWNNHFRSETVDDIMINTLDKIYDTSIFSKTHMAFKKTLMHVPDEEEVHIWDGQSGGIEGLQQDTWVITYLAQIKTALDPLNLKYHALCKGDDLRIAICIPNNTMNIEDIPQFKNQVMNSVSKTAKELGHKIKLEESFGSLKYFAFSKEASVGDIMLPQTLRKIQKVHGYNNAFLPYLDDMVGSTYSNAHASCKVHPTVLAPEITGLFWLYFYLLQHPQYQELTIDELVALTLVPSLCGGFPIIYHHNMYVRAESDLFSPFLGLLEFCRKQYPNLYGPMSNFCQIPLNTPTTLERVYKDPYAITTSMPPLPSTVLRNTMEKMLPNITKNEDVRRLIKAAHSVSSREFIAALDSANVLAARVFAALYAASPKGVLAEFLTKFETSRSVLQVLVLGSGRRRAYKVLRGLVHKEKTLQQWRYNMLKGKIAGSSYLDILDAVKCPAQAANMIRERAWGKRVETVTMPPLQHQVSIKEPDSSNITTNDIEGHFTFMTSKSATTLCRDERVVYSAGPYRPFEGYTTRTGTVEPIMTFVDKDVLLSKLQNIIELASWTNKRGINPETNEIISSNLHKLIDRLVVQYTDVPMSTFAPFIGCRRSGTVQHHIRCPGYRESIVPNTLLNIYTHVMGESDSNMLINQFPGQHYKINFLHIFCYVVCSIYAHNEVIPTVSDETLYWAITERCHYCMSPIMETPIIIDEQCLDNIDFSGLKTTKISEDAMDVLQHSLDVYKDRVYLVPNENSDLSNTVAAEGVIQELVETLMESKNTLISRYTQHATTGEGSTILGSFAVKSKRREIGLTELKRLSDRDLAVSTLNVVYYLLMTKLNWTRDTTMQMEISLVPPSELPWYDLVTYLHNYGRMSDIFRYMASRTQLNVVSAYNTAENCAQLLGNQAIAHADYYLHDMTIVILANYEMSRINSHTARQLFTLARYIDKTRVLQPLPRKYDNNWTPAQKAALLQRLYYWSIPYHDPEYLDIDHAVTGQKDLKLCEIITFYLDDVLTVWDTNEPEVISQRASSMLKFIMRQYRVGWDEVLEIHTECNEASIGTLTQLLDNFVITFVLTSLSDCIGKVREIVREESEESLVQETPRTKNVNTLECTAPKRSLMFSRFPSQGAESWINTLNTSELQSFPMMEEPYRHVEYLSRPFGVNNCSMSTLYYILHELGLIVGKPLVQISSLSVADGLGNFASALAKVFPNSKINYNSLHAELGLNYKPTELILSCEDNNCVLDYSCIKLGMTDLKDDYVQEYLSDKYPNQNIVTCDVELREWTPSVFHVYKNVVKLYMKVRCDPGLLVLKINHNYVMETIWVLHVIGMLCDNIYLVHPPTIRCHLISYVVAYGVKSHIYSEDAFPPCPLPKGSVMILGAYTKFRVRCINLHYAKMNETLDMRPKINPPISVAIRVVSKSPMLFLSMMSSVAGVYVDADNIMVNAPEADADNYFQEYAKFIIQITGVNMHIAQYKSHLESGRLTNFRNRSYDLEIRAHRVFVVQKLMTLIGLYFYLKYVQTTGRVVPSMREIKTYYLSSYDDLQARDKYGCEPPSHFGKMIKDRGINVSYYVHFMKGINLAMTSIAYARSSSVAGQRQRNEMEDHLHDQISKAYEEEENDEY